MQCRNLLLIVFFVVLALYGNLNAAQNPGLQNPDKSVVMIRSVRQDFDYVNPWKRENMSQSSGSGLIISGKRILTNAHNVSNNRYVELIKENVARQYPAKIVFIGHDCDLAILMPEDMSFFDDTVALEISGLPKVNSTVSTYGFPMGGDRISVTEGIVSRIESDVYAHSGADSHLVIQTDAAINPGNSGGPVIQDGKVVGVAFQGLQDADNIGYMIPTTVIDHFLKDIEDGVYNGFGSMGVILFPGLHSDSYREYLKVPENEDGIVVIGTLMHSSVESILKPGDVLTRIDEYNLDNDGMIQRYGLRLSISEAIESKQIGDTIEINFYRQGQLNRATATVALNKPIFEQSRQYDKPPPYVCFAGLVFVPATRNFLETWGPRWPREIPFFLRYLFSHSVNLNKDRNRKEYVVLSAVMSDEINSYAHGFTDKVVESINGITIESLNDVYKAFKKTSEDFYIIKFMDDDLVLPIDAKKAQERQSLILQKYNIPSEARLETEL